jgi:Domain of Unknown Function (DUF1080)/FG-GAP-like repeat
MLSRYRWIFVIVAAWQFAAAQAFASGPSFRPDVTISASSLDGWHQLGRADWKAEKGEIVGQSNQGGGWLVLDRSYQDVNLYAEYRCATGCITGVLLRAEKTADGGMKGVFVSLGDTTGDMENLAGCDIVIDAQGKIVSATPEQRGGGFTRVVSPWPPAPQASPAGGGRPGGFRRESTVDLPIHPPDTKYRPNDWNSVEFSFDANVVRENLNDGGQRGSLAAEGYGPIALYVAGAGEVEYRNIAISDLSLKTREPGYTSPDFRKQTLNEFYYGWGQAAADFNHDGHIDIASGPFIYYGPDFTKRREIWRGEATNPTTDFAMDSHEEFAGAFTGHPEWPDLITVKFGGGHCVYLYVNPRGENRIWDRYPVLDNVSSEISIVADIDGPGKPALVYTADGYVRYAEPDPANPTAPWIVHNVSQQGYATSHGLGAGDINGDGLVDIVDPYGWWEHPRPGSSDQSWKYHPEAFAQYSHGFMGGAVMAVYDVNGDGLPDVVTSLAAHGWGLAWFEQKRDAQGNISFVKHMVMDDFSTKNAGDVTFSELHGSGVADINGDGIPDFLVGKRWFSHLDSGLDPYTFGPPVLYWYETVRDPKAPGGARLVPHLIDNDSGVGNTVLAVDLNHSGALDIVTSTRFGTFIFWNQLHAKKTNRAAGAP